MSSTSKKHFGELDRYNRGRKLGEGAFGDVYAATVEQPPPPHLSTLGYTADTSLPLRGITPVSTKGVKRPAQTDLKSDSTTEPQLILSKADQELLARYDSLDDPSLSQTWEEYPVMQRFPARGSPVAIKSMKLSDYRFGLAREALREVRLLREVNHPNIMHAVDVDVSGQTLFLVMEVLPYDLEKLIRNQSVLLSKGDEKRYMYMLLQAMAYLHERGIVHRDLKPANLLIAPDGSIRVSDFGGAREVGSPCRRMSPEACTIWYRAPELLFGSTCYGTASDMWSVGCIFGEMLRRNALFMADSEINMLCKIAALMGTPSEETWPGMAALNSFFAFPTTLTPVPMRDLLPHAEPAARDLLSKLLQWAPEKRISAKEALQHPYFTTGEPMSELDQLPKPQK